MPQQRECLQVQIMPPIRKEAESLLKSKHSEHKARVFYTRGLINLQGTNNPFIIQIVLERGERV